MPTACEQTTMHDLVVREGIVAMARDAAKCLHGLVAAGEELPYEVREPGDGSPLCRYEPLTERFVRDHAGELRRFDSFGAACAALEASGLAGAYLESMGIGVPTEPRARAELAGIAFLCRLWMDTTDFSLDDERLEQAIAELEAAAETDAGEIDVIVPLRGLQIPIARLELAGVTIVRADTVEVPAEARSSDGLGVSPWEPAFLAALRVDSPDLGLGPEDDPGVAAVLAFRRLVSTLRLFKAGGVGLGPYAWTRQAGDRWRRIATGAGRQRPGGYRLTEAELADLAAFSRSLAQPGTPFSRRAADRPGFPATLGRAIDRFEAGLERNVVVEALNDHLLSLRFVLEGAGPAGLGLAMRVAALCAEPERRDEVKAVVDRAIGLERELWSGEPAPGRGHVTPAETAAELEDLARAIFKDAAAGHLGSDLRATADEILLADGIAAGDGAAAQRGGTTEWDLEPIEPDGEAADPSETTDALDDVPLSEEIAGVAAELDAAGADERLEDEADLGFEWETREVKALDQRISEESSPLPQEQMVIERAREIFEQQADAEVADRPGEPGDQQRSPVLRLIEQTKAERQAHHERVADLFPAPETTEWKVREIAYDRTRRARVKSS